jgi:hypothetical protein
VEDQAMVIARSRSGRRPVRTWLERLAAVPTTRDIAWALVAITAGSILLRIILASLAQAPVVFSDELGYEKLAQSIGRTGHLALFNEHGLSYSPLYPLVLAPIYALGVSAPTAYGVVKVVNALLMSLAIFPTYMIARFALPRRESVVVAGMSAVAPLMFYTSFSMSENLAYPVCLAAIWALLVTIRSPSARNDAVLLVSILLATAARIQLIVLVPAALTAVVLHSAVAGGSPLRKHRLLFGAVAAALLVAAAGGLAGVGVFSAFGRYADVGRAHLPGFGHFLDLLVRHTAGVDLAVGVVPFAAAIVATVAFARRGFRGSSLPFAVVAVSVTVWLLAEVAYDAAVFDGRGDIPRIHERFLIYVVPLFLVALLATVRIPEGLASRRLYFGAAAIAAFLPLVIPFHSMVNQTIGFETFALQPLAHVRHGRLSPIPLAPAAAVTAAAILGLLFVHVRRQTRALVLLVLIPLGLVSTAVMGRNASTSRFTRSLLPAETNWVDAARPSGAVALVTAAEDPIPALETAYANYSISRLYYLCRPVAGPEFGERRATIDASGGLRGPAGPVTAAYAVAPAGLGVEGRIVAHNRPGRQVLVALPRDRLGVSRATRATALCRS